MGIGVIILGIIIFLFGLLTPVSNFITIPISIIAIWFGIKSLIKMK